MSNFCLNCGISISDSSNPDISEFCSDKCETEFGDDFYKRAETGVIDRGNNRASFKGPLVGMGF